MKGLGTAIDLVERGILPDRIARTGIRRLASCRLVWFARGRVFEPWPGAHRMEHQLT